MTPPARGAPAGGGGAVPAEAGGPPPAEAASGAALPPGRFLYDAFLQFLRDDGWPIEAEEDGYQAVAVPVEGNSGRWICGGQIMDDRALLLFTSVIPVYVPPPVREAVSEFLHRANAGLLYGGFQYGLDEGEVRYVNSLDLSAVDPEEAAASGLLPGLIRRLVYANVATTDRYLPALMSVIYSGTAPADAVAGAETKPER